MYRRVIPRDLFNEAGLLNCLGKLAVHLDNEPEMSDEWLVFDNYAFDVDQSDDDGSLYLRNLTLHVRGRKHYMSRPYNTRDKWSLYLHDRDDDIAVFDDDGNLSAEMRTFLLRK